MIKGEELVMILYSSRSTRPDVRKCYTRELKVLVMLAILEYFHHYIDGQHVYLQTYPRNMLWLRKVREPSGRIGRWVLQLSEYDYMISHKAGQYMHIANYMSRNALYDTSVGRMDHTVQPVVGCRMTKAPVKWDLNCKEMVSQKLFGYEVSSCTMSVEFELSQVEADVCEGMNDRRRFVNFVPTLRP